MGLANGSQAEDHHTEFTSVDDDPASAFPFDSAEAFTEHLGVLIFSGADKRAEGEIVLI